MFEKTPGFGAWERPLGLDRLSAEDRARVVFTQGAERNGPSIHWLGHSSFLIVWEGQRILLDPVFARWIGPVRRACPLPEKRISELRPTAILVSHAHLDHLDWRSLQRFDGVPIYLPGGSGSFLPKLLRARAQELAPGEEIQLGDLRFEGVVALHGGWRYPWQLGRQAFGYLLSNRGDSLYFGGDSAYGGYFKKIGAERKIDWALLPIGSYAPRWFLKTRHMNPEEAILAFADLGAKRMIPYHFGGYRLSLEPLWEPLPRFARAAREKGVDWCLPIAGDLREDGLPSA
jgi:L-ascorbate metabolism protein UlaG (beta-lactamase superfamily)